MVEYESKGSGRELDGVLFAAKSLQKTLLKRSKEHPDSTRIAVSVTDPGSNQAENPTETSARCTFIIKSATADEAFKHAEELTADGCNCLSSGENEFTCHCDD